MTEDAVATQLRLLFSENEDRLILLVSCPDGVPEGLLLTRRLTARLINGIAVVLERSSVLASKAPEELKADIVLMEHQGALAGEGNGTSGSPAPGAVEDQQIRMPPRLVSAVNLTTSPTTFQLVFQPATGGPVAMVLNRLDLHRVLELLKRQAESVGWNLQIDAAWLGEDQSLLTVN